MNSLPLHDHHKTDQQIDRALQTLTTAQPGHADAAEAHTAFNAMNARLLRNIRRRRAADTSRSRNWTWWPKAGLALAILSAAYAVFLHLPAHKADDPLLQHVANSASMPSQHAVPQALTTAGSSLRSTLPARSASLASATSKRATHASPVSIDPAFLPSSPAPVAPLSHQEELLLSATRGPNSTLLAQLENHSSDLARTEPRPDPNPLFAGFRPEPVEADTQASIEQVPESPATASAQPSNASQSDLPNETTTEFRP